MLQQLWQPLSQIRVADVFDIAFVALFLYAVMTWFKRTASRSILVGISLLGVVYFAARAFDMYMTAQLFHAAFAVLLIALVVVFQEDLRRVFERVATLGTLRGRLTQSGPKYLDIVVEVMADLATQKIGALLVVRGLEPLDRHIEGGVVVDGQISKPLLESIFDPHSSGHDGAVILEGNRLRRFGTHLPLSHNQRALERRGTRHSAALGLSERCDALAVVVSEERGVISVAREGKLTEMQTPGDLQQALDQFSRETFPQPSQSVLGRLIRENGLLKAAALAVAFAAWLVAFNSSETVQRTETLPIEYLNLGKELVIDDKAPRTATVTFSGLKQAFTLADVSKLKVSVDLDELSEGPHKLSVSSGSVASPPGNIKVEKIDPEAISIQLYRKVELPVAVEMTGRIPPGYEKGQIMIEPPQAVVQLGRPEDVATTKVFAEPFDVTGLTQTTTRELALKREAVPKRVSVTVEIKPVAPP